MSAATTIVFHVGYKQYTMSITVLYERKPLVLAWVLAYIVVCAAVFSDQLFLKISALIVMFLTGWLVILAATQ